MSTTPTSPTSSLTTPMSPFEEEHRKLEKQGSVNSMRMRTKSTVLHGVSSISELNLKIDEDIQDAYNKPQFYNRSIAQFKSKKGLSARAKILSRERNVKRRVFVLDIDESYFIVWKSNMKSKKLTVFLKDIKEVVPKATVVEVGSTLKKLFVKKITSDSNLSFIIKYGSQHKEEIHMVCDTREDYATWLTCLNKLIIDAHIAYDNNPVKVIIMKQWQKADANGDGKLDFKEIAQLLHKLNIDMPSRVLKRKFQEADSDNSGYIEYGEFIEFYKSLMRRQEIDELFNKYNTKFGQLIFAEDFLQFLHDDQHEVATVMDFAVKIMSLNGAITTELGLGLTKHDFTRYLFSASNSLTHPEMYTKYNDMNQPLTHYYIASSHNTYLTGHQLHGESSVDMYRKVLYSGCRCVELDCWDGKDGDPIIFHGHTLTSKIKFKDVVHCILQNAFVASEYPVILSLEVHCSVPQQEKMAEYMKDAFKDLLVMPSEVEAFRENESNGFRGEYPSPEQLKRRILIKGKRIQGNNQDVVEEEEEDDEDTFLDLEDEEALDATDKKSLEDSKRKKKVHHKVAQKLSDITALSAVSFKPPLKVDKAYKMHSFSETKVRKLIDQDYLALVEYNKNQFSRIYPKGTRFSSTNYDPTPAWNAGSQLVALNYQTNCKFQRLNLIKFAENGNTGYLLKPAFLRDPSIVYDITKINRPLHHFTISIISGEAFPKPLQSDKGEVVDPFIKLQVHGVDKDNSINFETKTVWDNGFNPVWNEVFDFDIYCLDLAYLRLSVYDKNNVAKDIFLCENIIPLNEVRLGYRQVPLRNESSKLVEGASILIHTASTRYEI